MADWSHYGNRNRADHSARGTNPLQMLGITDPHQDRGEQRETALDPARGITMPSVAINLWPRWLRIAVVGVATAAVIAGGWLAYRYFAKPIYLTVAAGSVDSEALSLISAIAARLTASGAHTRLKVVDSQTSASASQLLASGKADLAV